MALAPERFKLIASVYLVLTKDGKTLLSRRFRTGYEDGKYGLVAGHIEGKETLRQALAREVREEAGVTLNVSDLALGHTMHRWCGDHERLDFFFTADTYVGTIVNKEPRKCDDIAWVPLDALPENTIDYVRLAIENCVNKVEYSEYGWETFRE
ncbi:MAG: NUDIX domain-containing protein [Candidatus Uhrbacteria bacterium]